LAKLPEGFRLATLAQELATWWPECLPMGVEASLRALEELSAGDAAQRVALSSKLEQLEYEAKKAFEQYDAVDARNRLAASESERRWNEKLEEIEVARA
jgi:hypothetical protein